MTDKVDKKKCSKCNCYRDPKDFLGKNNRELKQCANCRGFLTNII